MITKKIGQKLNFYECLQLLDKAAEYGIIERAEDNCLKMYWKSERNEGWTAISIITCAQILADDIDGQTFYREALKRQGVEMSDFCEWKKFLKVVS